PALPRAARRAPHVGREPYAGYRLALVTRRLVAARRTTTAQPLSSPRGVRSCGRWRAAPLNPRSTPVCGLRGRELPRARSRRYDVEPAASRTPPRAANRTWLPPPL